VARLSRLSVAHRLHLVVQRGHGQAPIFIDDLDREACLVALRDAAALHALAVHAYALWDDAVWWLATPQDPSSIGRTVQAMGQRFVAGFNRRHGLRGTRWDGRFRCAVVEASHAVALSVLMEQGPLVPTTPRDGGEPARGWPWSSAAHHLGLQRTPWLTDLPGFWTLGNTPFDRETAYRQRLGAPRNEALLAAAMHAAARGWALGGPAFTQEVAMAAGRTAAPKPRGRPKRQGSNPIAMSLIK
jgi:putative transposase